MDCKMLTHLLVVMGWSNRTLGWHMIQLIIINMIVLYIMLPHRIILIVDMIQRIIVRTAMCILVHTIVQILIIHTILLCLMVYSSTSIIATWLFILCRLLIYCPPHQTVMHTRSPLRIHVIVRVTFHPPCPTVPIRHRRPLLQYFLHTSVVMTSCRAATHPDSLPHNPTRARQGREVCGVPLPLLRYL